ncbi:ammonium transporter [Marinimicrobium koreense]|uniref:ammonium transporter n=1 Tax=Marinimicrobium koreense TaxID=306545 RepID=UPI003F71372A
MNPSLLDVFWLVLCSALVFNMQLGFLCLESGLTRSKNAINVALKNMTDFALAVLLYWLFGFGLMFGVSVQGWLGMSDFLPAVGHDNGWLSAFFLFQAMFCATAVTIISGASAERLRFAAYIWLGVLVAGVVYPVFGHWAWAGGHAQGQGWLASMGFVDFAGSTVVHSVGGWVSLAVLLIIGPRTGRFDVKQPARTMPGSNLPLAMLGALLLFFGWFGFNGGSTLAADATVPGIVVNTLLGGVSGVLAVLFVNWRLKGFTDAMMPMNGLLAGLVSVTAGAHALSAVDALFAGAVGGLVMMVADALLLRWKVDDAVGAVPVHLAAGIWGTLAVGFLGDPEAMGTGLGTGAQLLVQAQGVLVCAVWSFGVAYVLLRLLNRVMPLRVDAESERLGLNISEHGTRTELIELLEAMEGDAQAGDFHGEVPVEPFTEVGQIANQYNKVIRALSRAVQTTQAIVRDIRDGIITFTADGALTSFNPGSQKMFALPTEASDVHLRHLLEDGAWRPDHWLPSPGGEIKREVRCRRRDGSDFLAELTVSQDGLSESGLYTGIVRDITERRRIQDQLYHEKNLAQVTLASIGDGVITANSAGRIQYINPVAEQLLGCSARELVEQPLDEVYQVVDEATGKPLPSTVAQVLTRPYRSGARPEEQHRALKRKDGRTIPVQDSAAPIRDMEGRLIGVVLTFSDVSVTRELARELTHQAAHDALTGLLNRAEFERRLERLMQEDPEGSHVLCYLDLDQFKVVNDTCGHIAGDELLRQLAVLFQSRVRDSDVLARLGGDEFGIVLNNCGVDEALQVADSIRELVEDFRFSWESKTFAVGVSIGLVPIEHYGKGLSPLLGAADAACYAAKDGGRNRVHVYEPDDQLLLERQGEMQWVNRIRRALDEDRLRLYVQPIVSLDADDEVPRYEVLVRMLDENGGVIPPGAFMPAAERYSVATAIDRWVVANTLAWVGDDRRKRGRVSGDYSINVSADSITDRDFLDFVLSCLQRSQVPPESICFEITETSAIANLSSAIRFIERLKSIGCRFALDDFGSGVSSFGYLKNLPVDFIKIDGSFVKDICRDSTARVMVGSINNIGQEMGLKTVAEFVESADILEALRELGVDFAQGYYLGKPKPLTALQEVRMMPR